eukprot:11204742-Lingulodinium_polyedra.AAC.1
MSRRSLTATRTALRTTHRGAASEVSSAKASDTTMATAERMVNMVVGQRVAGREFATQQWIVDREAVRMEA